MKLEIKTLAGKYLKISKNNLDIDLCYPVGSIYMSVNDAEPSVLFGGTWEKINDRFLLASGENNVGSTGGEKEHTLSVQEMPKHTHNILRPRWYSRDLDNQESGSVFALTTSISEYAVIGQTDIYNNGEDMPHNNMPPYLVVNIWKRIS